MKNSRWPHDVGFLGRIHHRLRYLRIDDSRDCQTNQNPKKARRGKQLMNLPKGPWRYGEAKGGKWFVYTADDDRPLFVRNVSATGRFPEQNATIDKAIAAIPQMISALTLALESELYQATERAIRDALKKAGQEQ
jgi:hypothetical protein